MRFNTNHDENAYDAPSIERYGPGGDSLTVALIATLPGVPLIYNGDEVGNPKRLSLFKQVLIDWKVENGFRALYERIYSIRKSVPELRGGTFIPLSAEGGNVLAYERQLNHERAVCVFNFSKTPLPKVVVKVDGVANGVLAEKVTGRRYKITDGTFEMPLKSYGFGILVLQY